MKRIFVLVALFLAGCANSGISKSKTDNPSIATVDVLFTDADGFTVKRFYDAGRFCYYATPGPSVVTYSHTDGKTTTIHSIPTAKDK